MAPNIISFAFTNLDPLDEHAENSFKVFPYIAANPKRLANGPASASAEWPAVNSG
jgi:hypothetical protein